ncbi:copper homeostasis protein CutC [Reichenbachiella carrageenanivorans]|uniref:PF03932 family protein CutC n=1 Tax=Reichenbachiella carrageenanivorans TaxID=2979869 RepID=A0ABY6D238_9BACT|nr:copper homeostasis protein CutC [Reichenbachiella carrageenanivorans]UXX79158.1 copper homeostasis protein CutC [Reichenbachiella carrageenanivorans]
MIKEACVENLAEALKAEDNGADQVELCGRLDLDGLTPERDLVEQVLKQISIPVKVMVRPRGGNFVYSSSEVEEMHATIELMKSLGVQEVVLGLLTEQGEIACAALTRLVQTAQPMKVTFHKAIDELADPVTGVKQLLEVKGITSVLTSGGAPTAEAGVNVLQQMKVIALNQIQIIAAGKITNKNLVAVDQLIKADAYHGKLIVGSLK